MLRNCFPYFKIKCLFFIIISIYLIHPSFSSNSQETIIEEDEIIDVSSHHSSFASAGFEVPPQAPSLKVSKGIDNEVLEYLNTQTPQFVSPLEGGAREIPIDLDLEDLLKKQSKGSRLMGCLEAHTACCACYHIGCQSLWSFLNGPLGLSSLISSAGSTVISTLAAAALFSDPELVRNLAISGTVTSATAAVLGSLKMYAASRTTTELIKASDDILLTELAFLQQLKGGRDVILARYNTNKEDRELEATLAAWNQAVIDHELKLATLLEYVKIAKEHHQTQLDAAGKEQSFILTATNMNAVLAGNTTTDEINLPRGYQCCQSCLRHYDVGTFAFYQVVQGPAGLLNTLGTTSAAVLLGFSIFNTGSVQAGLIYGSAVSNAAATLFAAVKFYSGARVTSALNRIRNWKLYDVPNTNLKEREIDI